MANKTIDALAFQADLLNLTASLETARTGPADSLGDAGGAALRCIQTAGEIRSLAEGVRSRPDVEASAVWGREYDPDQVGQPAERAGPVADGSQQEPETEREPVYVRKRRGCPEPPPER